MAISCLLGLTVLAGVGTAREAGRVESHLSPDVAARGAARGSGRLCAPGGRVVLNEIAASVAGVAPDWVELYNPGPQEVSLDGLSLSDSDRSPRKYVFPANLRLPAGGHLLVDLDGDAPATDRNAGFALKAEGDDLTLYTRAGAVLDRVEFGPQLRDLTIGRVPDGSGPWRLTAPSPESSNRPAALGSPANLRINEWMASPVTGDDWFELYNTSDLPVCLTGLRFHDDLTDPPTIMTELAFIGCGREAFRVFSASGSLATPTSVNFKLSGDGETIYLFHTDGALIDLVTFGPQRRGTSEGRIPDGSGTTTSFAVPTPEDSNFQVLPGVWINEILTHTDNPFEDAVEFFNPTEHAVDIGGFYLSDSTADLKRYRLPAPMLVPARGYAVIYESEFNAPTATNHFRLDSAGGDTIHLTAADAAGALTGFRCSVVTRAAANGVSFGRVATDDRMDYVPVKWPTFGVDNPNSREGFRQGAGGSNAPPIVGPVVINEVMFHPPDLIQAGVTNDNLFEEFVELHNVTPYPVALHDPEFPTNTWAVTGGIEFSFPPAMTVEPCGYVLLVRFDPVEQGGVLQGFQERYRLPANVVVIGPYDRRLSNRSDLLELTRPDTPQSPPSSDTGCVPRLLVDSVTYEDRSPWPDNADGTGASLQRVSATAYGNTPRNWIGGAPTPGAPTAQDPADRDADGMPDAWERECGLDGTDPQDAVGDDDSDGLSNLQEFMAGTDPHDTHSHLRIGITRTEHTNHLEFLALANRTYTVQYRPTLRVSINCQTWFHVGNVPAAPFDRYIRLDDLNKTNSVDQYYRVITPAE